MFGGVTISKQGNKFDDTLINEDIRVKELLVISDQGEKLGILSRDKALQEADARGLDLVLISPEANPAVAKLMDFSKFRFEQQKKAKLQKKNQKVVPMKEVQFTPTTEKHDFDTKVRKIVDFVEHGSKVKIALKFQKGRGRMAYNPELCLDILKKILADLPEEIQIDAQPKQEGRNFYAIVAPKKEKKQ